MTENMASIVERAERVARSTGRPTCLVCREMRVRQPGEASCRATTREIAFGDGNSYCLPSMTLRAGKCEQFDSMLDGELC